MSRITARLGGGLPAIVLVAFAGWSLIPLVVAIQHLVAEGGVWSGVYGGGVIDHFDYLSWVREAGEHVAISNRFDVADDPAIYVQPQWIVGGLIWKLTGSVQLGFLVFQPVAVAVLFLGFAAYVRRLVDGRWAQAAALVLALFYWPVAAPLMSWLGAEEGRGVVELFGYELAATNYVWGYFQTAISIGLMPVFLLAVEGLLVPERRRSGRSARWYAVAAAAAGAGVSWTHPWQGFVILAVVAGALVLGRGRELNRSLALPILATAAPLVYFWALSLTDSAWQTGAEPEDAAHHWRWLALALVPIALAAVPGYLAKRPLARLDLQDRMLLVTPLAALVLYAVADRTFYYHFVSGMTLPLAVLAVRGFAMAGTGRVMRLAAVAGVVVCTLPGLYHVVDLFRQDVQSGALARYFQDGEHDALEYLDDHPRDGPVLARVYLGEAVPAFAGRQTYVGHTSWTPDFTSRVDETEALFGGRMRAPAARDLLRRSRAAFVLSDCNEPADLRPALGDAVADVRRFGCSTVYELRE